MIVTVNGAPLTNIAPFAVNNIAPYVTTMINAIPQELDLVLNIIKGVTNFFIRTNGDLLGIESTTVNGMPLLGKSLSDMPLVGGAVSIAVRSIMADLGSELFVDYGWISDKTGKWARTALQSVILVETFATGLVISVLKLILGAFIKNAAGGVMMSVGKIMK